ncbi:hypothetical protein AgCh_022436 [Apium graveolens]
MFEFFIRRVHDHPSGCLVDHSSSGIVVYPSEARKPTTSSSQKNEVSKKKRKQAHLKVVSESGEDNTELESHLAPARPNYSLVLYYTAERPVKENSLLGRFVNGSDAFRDSRFKLIPSIIEGYWMVKRAVGTKACLLGKEVTRRYLRHDNFLEDPNFVDERLHAGVDLDDTNTNTGVPSVFTKDPMVVSNASSCANQPSQVIRFEGSSPEGSYLSSPIQLEVPLEGTTPLKTLAKIALIIEAMSSIANDPAMGDASTSHSSDSALK